MAKLETKIEVEVTAAIQQAFIEFARDCEKKYGVMINEVEFDWHRSIDGRGYVTECSMNTRKIG